ncbi:MAG: AsnC family transcriptional regulator [Nitrospiraceae bacterium]|nr:AsnC family transcriptional regulator [Nitrospiraceae bacterium]
MHNKYDASPGDPLVLDDVDLAMLRLLQADASITNAELAANVRLSPSACLSRTRRLREGDVIERFTAVVDAKNVGLTVTAFAFATLSKHSRSAAESFRRRIEATTQVMECYNITGRADYLLKIVAPDISAYRDFVIDQLIEIPEVEHVETLVVLKTEKRSFDLPLDHAGTWRK